VTFGATAGAQVELDLRQVYHRHIQIIGTTLGSPWEFEGLLRPLASGAIKPVIDSIFPLTQASDAQRRLESGLQFGKIVLEIE
jgi:zinc-binding alcohol dehydrogenase/oxidoreductase